LPRSTLRHALRAGALCLTATSTVAVPATAHAAGLGVNVKHLNVHTGSRVTVAGRVEALAPDTGRPTVSLQIRRRGRWLTIDRSHVRVNGRFVLRDRARRPESAPARIRLSTGERRSLGRLNVYRTAIASWYGPGLFGRPLGCGGTLRAGSLGVANKTLPCGTKLTIRHGGRTVRVPVIDRGPYVGGREFDLTSATASRLHFRGHGAILVTR
jgi:rare lipoprotein A